MKMRVTHIFVTSTLHCLHKYMQNFPTSLIPSRISVTLRGQSERHSLFSRYQPCMPFNQQTYTALKGGKREK